jgi:hypothetical protein
LDCPSVEFGLIRLGDVKCVPLKLSNHSNCLVDYELKQVINKQSSEQGHVDQDSDTLRVDYECLDMSPSSGQLLPNSSATVQVQCTPKERCGRLRTVIECIIEGCKSDVIEVNAEVQRPLVSLDKDHVHIDMCYQSVPIVNTIILINRTLLPTNYQWVKKQYDYVELDFEPKEGLIGPHQSVLIRLSTIWKYKGDHSGIIGVCSVEGMTQCVLLSISSKVHGLSVTHHITNEDNKYINIRAIFAFYNVV